MADLPSLWDKIEGGIIQSGGPFSKKTLSVASDLNEEDSGHFTSLCKFVCEMGRFKTPVILDFKADVYTDQGVDFGVLHHLQDLGLIRFAVLSTFLLNHESVPKVQPDFLPARYHDHSWTLILEDGWFSIGHVSFTRAGSELFPFCSPSLVPGFAEYLQEQWKDPIRKAQEHAGQL